MMDVLMEVMTSCPALSCVFWGDPALSGLMNWGEWVGRNSFVGPITKYTLRVSHCRHYATHCEPQTRPVLRRETGIGQVDK